MAEEPGLPWLYPYLEDADSTRLGLPVFRPFVPVSLVGPAGSSPIYDGLIDTGSDAILASDLVADYVGLDLEDQDGETTHAVAGAVMTARYKTVNVRLHRPDSDPDTFQEWEAPIGFIEGWQNPSLLLLGSVASSTDQLAGARSRRCCECVGDIGAPSQIEHRGYPGGRHGKGRCRWPRFHVAICYVEGGFCDLLRRQCRSNRGRSKRRLRCLWSRRCRSAGVYLARPLHRQSLSIGAMHLPHSFPAVDA